MVVSIPNIQEDTPMRLMTGHSKTNTTYHIIRDVNKNGKRSTEIVENLGSADEICEKYVNQVIEVIKAKGHLA